MAFPHILSSVAVVNEVRNYMKQYCDQDASKPGLETSLLLAVCSSKLVHYWFLDDRLLREVFNLGKISRVGH